MSEKIGVVLLNLGGPDSLEAVEPFLYNLFCDPDIIDFPLSFLFRKRLARFIAKKRHPRIQKQYKEIGGRSPLKEYTLRQAELLERKLNETIEAKVYVAMRYWTPFTEDALETIRKDGVTRVILLPLFPQYSKATTASSMKEWEKHLRSKGMDKSIETTLIESYYRHPTYIDAFIERINEGLERFPTEARSDVHLVFSAHGTPMKLVREGDPYSHQIAGTVAEIMHRGDYSQPYGLCYQSKVGPLKWLTPSTPETIERLAAEGAKDMLVIPVAFTSDHLETLFELNIEYRRLAEESGVRQYEVIEGLNDSPTFIDALAQLALEKVVGTSGASTST